MNEDPERENLRTLRDTGGYGDREFERVDRCLEYQEENRAIELFEKLRAVNKEQKLTKGSFTVKDIASCIEIANELPKVIEY
jgi:hypothetical protein